MRNILLLFLVLLLVVLSFSLGAHFSKTQPGDLFIANQKYIGAVYNNLDLNNETEVFEFVFSHLEDTVVVYPTENYYYFQFPSNDHVVSGSFSLSADSRDQGIIGFSYVAKPRYPARYPFSLRDFNLSVHALIGGGGEYNESNGVFVKRINATKYSVTYEDKTVVFLLHMDEFSPPQKANLTEEEVFIGPVFDESGIRFYFLFNNEIHDVYFILNEDYEVPETFVSVDDVLVGERTGFVFYNDSINNRLILVGVNGENVLENNWFDGPFDQMPDNYIYQGLIPNYKKYIEMSYPSEAGKIDKYGNHVNSYGTRVAVGPYVVYFSKEDLLVDDCKALDLANSEFYGCITIQVYDSPEE